MAATATATSAAPRVRVDPTRLEDAVTGIYTALGLPPDEARIAAWGVVIADLRGHESHGVSNSVTGAYVPGLRSGEYNPRPNIRMVQERSIVSRWDGDRGLGFVVGHRVMQWVHRAREGARRRVRGRRQLAPLRHGPVLLDHGARARPHRVVHDQRGHARRRAVPGA